MCCVTDGLSTPSPNLFYRKPQVQICSIESFQAIYSLYVWFRQTFFRVDFSRPWPSPVYLQDKKFLFHFVRCLHVGLSYMQSHAETCGYPGQTPCLIALTAPPTVVFEHFLLGGHLNIDEMCMPGTIARASLSHFYARLCQHWGSVSNAVDTQCRSRQQLCFYCILFICGREYEDLLNVAVVFQLSVHIDCIIKSYMIEQSHIFNNIVWTTWTTNPVCHVGKETAFITFCHCDES